VPDLGQRRLHGRDVGRAAECERAWQGDYGARPDRDEQVVVATVAAPAEARGPGARVDARQLALDERHRVAAREVVEVEGRRRAQAERRRDRRGPLLERVRRREQLDLEVAARQVA
jgi:hypothetical protein